MVAATDSASTGLASLFSQVASLQDELDSLKAQNAALMEVVEELRNVAISEPEPPAENIPMPGLIGPEAAVTDTGIAVFDGTTGDYVKGTTATVDGSGNGTFATVNTGQGANELYAMDQDVETTDSPTFAGLTINGNIGVTGTVDGTDIAALKTDVDGFPDALKNLATAEINQLENIGATTISATQWGYLGASDQGTATTDAVTFATVNTGQGANELYAMDQNVRTTDAVTFLTVNTGQGANELYAMDQAVRTSDTVEFDEVGVGVSAPSEKLHVKGSGATSMKVESTNTTATVIVHSDSGNDNNVWAWGVSPTSDDFMWFDQPGGSANKLRIWSNGAVVVGSASGGSGNGAGTINAVGVYDDNTLLTDYVFDAAVDGGIDYDKYDEAHNKPHIPARTFDSDELDPQVFASKWKSSRKLPAIARYEKENLSTGEFIQALTETTEVLAVHLESLREQVSKITKD